MKRRMLIVLAMVLSAASIVYAQNNGKVSPPQNRGPDMSTAEAATVSGTLTLVQGAMAVKSGDTTYFTPGLMRYTNIIDGLKEGAQVKLVGRAIANPNDAKQKTLFVDKLTLNGKEHDLERPAREARPAPAPGTRPAPTTRPAPLPRNNNGKQN